MKRMTERGERGNAYYPQCFKEPCEGMGCKIDLCKFSEAACDRLAAYEDSGLSPEDAANLHAILRLGDGMTLMRMRELAVADKEGRVIVIPCEIGHAAYWVHNGVITVCRINRIQANRKGVCLCLKSKKAHGAFRVDTCLGKTVFLTREEAEKALAELEGKDG